MQTQLLTPGNIDIAARIIRSGGTVVFPTETVYGLGANALNASACEKIFAAKGRPADNPLIVHVSSREEMGLYARSDDRAFLLWERFMPGPLSLILPKRDCIPSIVTAGMDSVAIRCPAHPVARALISAAGCPIAAPSANLSGRPSPTEFEHARQDMLGRVDAIIEDGSCEVGMESTVLSLVGPRAVLLRPGAITPDMLRAVLGSDGLEIAPSLLQKLEEDAPAPSPGMKYRHYAPDAPMYLVEGEDTAVLRFLSAKSREAGCGILCWDEDVAQLDGSAVIVPLGSRDSQLRQGQRLFAALREFDGQPVKAIYSRTPSPDGLGLALLNRMLRAAGFNTIKV